MENRKQLSPRQRRRRKKAILRSGLLALAAALLLTGVGLGLWALLRPEQAAEEPPAEPPVEETPAVAPVLPEPEPEPEPEPQPVGLATDGPAMVRLEGELGSEYAVIIDADTNTVLAEKGENALLYPASMTKALTLLVAAENIDDPDAPFTMTQELIDPHYSAGATITGYRAGDVCTLRDLFYGAALRSSADATSALAVAAAGDESAFVALMNEKARTLGLSAEASFTNPAGMFHSDHVCTARDMAAILRAAMANDLCREVLSTSLYVTPPTEAEADGLIFQNKYLGWFREKQPEGVEVLACKNGYVYQARNCMVSYGVNAAGRALICVTARAADAETMMNDQRYLFTTYGK